MSLSEQERELLTCDCEIYEDDADWPETYCPFHADRLNIEVSGSTQALIETVERILANRLADAQQRLDAVRAAAEQWDNGCSREVLAALDARGGTA